MSEDSGLTDQGYQTLMNPTRNSIVQALMRRECSWNCSAGWRSDANLGQKRHKSR